MLEMLEQERLELMPMPSPFDGYVEKPARVSSTCLVSVARNRYSVPCELANHQVSTRLYPTWVEVAAADAIVASHERLADSGHIRYDWQHYIALVQSKPGALRRRSESCPCPWPWRTDSGNCRVCRPDRVHLCCRRLATLRRPYC